MNQGNFNKDEDEKFFTEFKEKMAIDPLSDTVRHIEKQASKRQMFTILVLVVMASVAGICWNMYSSYISVREPATEIISLQPDIAPDKVRPENPGGMIVPNQDKTVYSRVSPSTSSQTEEIVISQPLTENEHIAVSSGLAADVTSASNAADSQWKEQLTVIYDPSKRNLTANEALETKSSNDGNAYQSLFSQGASEVANVAATSGKTDIANGVSNSEKIPTSNISSSTQASSYAEVTGNKKENEVVTTSASSQSSKIAEDKSKTEQVSKPAQKVESTNKAETKQKVSKDTLFAKDGVWRIQLLSSGEQKAVNDAWKRIYRKHESILEGYEHEVTSADVKGKTTYRLRVKAFASRADANKVCNLLKAAKQDCMVVKN